jgi:hypothetical protein
MSSLFNPYEITPFLMPRPAAVPYQVPHATDMSGIISAIGDIGNTFMTRHKMEQQKEMVDREMAQRERERMQQAAATASGQQITMRGQDLAEQGRKDVNERLDRDKAEGFIRQALTSGDESDVRALDLAARGLGWSREELPSQYKAPEAPQQTLSAPAGPAGPTDFDTAYKSMTQKESGGNPRAVNPKSGAMGTFQLMPDQLPQGVSKEQFLAMTPDQQKQIYETKYLPAHGLSRDTLAPQDVGLSVGAPAAIAMPDDAVVYPKGSKAVRDNPTWDRNGDGQITKAELRQNYGGGAGGGPPSSPGITLPDQQLGRPMPGPIDTNAPYNVGTDTGKPGGPPKALQDFMSDAYGVAPLPQQQLGGGRHVFKDQQGNVVAEVDLPAIRARHQESLNAALTPILDGAKTPAEKQAAQQALGFATKAVDSGQYSWKEAANEAIKFYQSSVGEAGKTARSGVSGQLQQLRAANQQADHIIGQVARDARLPAMNDAERDLQGTVDALGTNSGPGDVIALRKLLKSIEGRATDADYTSMVNSSGWLNKFMNIPDNVLEGRLTPEVIAEVKSNVQLGLQAISARKKAAAEQAAHSMEQALPYLDDDTQRKLANRVNDYFYPGTPSAPSRGGATPGGSGPSNDEVLKALGQ